MSAIAPILRPQPCQEQPFGFGGLRPPIPLENPPRELSRRALAFVAFALAGVWRPADATLH